jgi:hypothetical protein
MYARKHSQATECAQYGAARLFLMFQYPPRLAVILCIKPSGEYDKS